MTLCMDRHALVRVLGSRALDTALPYPPLIERGFQVEASRSPYVSTKHAIRHSVTKPFNLWGQNGIQGSR